jgi:hypothetical protein
VLTENGYLESEDLNFETPKNGDVHLKRLFFDFVEKIV